MEKAYRTVLEIIKKMCEKDGYLNTDTIKLMCETALDGKDTKPVSYITASNCVE